MLFQCSGEGRGGGAKAAKFPGLGQEMLKECEAWVRNKPPFRNRSRKELGGLQKASRMEIRRRKDPSPPTSHGVHALTWASLSVARKPGSSAFPQALPDLCELTLPGRG